MVVEVEPHDEDGYVTVPLGVTAARDTPAQVC